MSELTEVFLFKKRNFEILQWSEWEREKLLPENCSNSRGQLKNKWNILLKKKNLSETFYFSGQSLLNYHANKKSDNLGNIEEVPANKKVIFVPEIHHAKSACHQ